MSNDFFDRHPSLGPMFDHNHNGSIEVGEAFHMGAMGALWADEMERVSREEERELGIRKAGSDAWPLDGSLDDGEIDDELDDDELGYRRQRRKHDFDPWDDEDGSVDDDW